jgi:hypothetical protein
MNTVLTQTSGFAARVSILAAMYVAPAAGDAFGCSSNPAGGSSQLTVGSWSLATSYSKLPTGEFAMALSYSGSPGLAS